jgi:hypothetical protein
VATTGLTSEVPPNSILIVLSSLLSLNPKCCVKKVTLSLIHFPVEITHHGIVIECVAVENHV